MIKVFEYTNNGCREENQDYVVHGSLPDGSFIAIIADAMGGYAEGGVAAKTVATSIYEYASNNCGLLVPNKLLKEAVAFGNDALMLKRIEMAVQKTGCVIAVLLLSDKFAYIAWLGDSRIYMYRQGQEVYRTEDYSVINELAGCLPDDAESYQRLSSMVTKSVMGEVPMDTPSLRKVQVEKGDMFILCTDGFYKEVGINNALSPDRCQLDSLASSIGDNYSFIKIEV